MKTYQDLLKVPDNIQSRSEFVRQAINLHKSSQLYKTAVLAQEYAAKRNRTIRQYQKLLYKATGEAIPDNVSANYKVASSFFSRFVTQEVQYLLGNGTSWQAPETAERLGADFDLQLQKAGKAALVGGVSFGFFDLDRLRVFDVTEFVPIYDEKDGAMKAGIRFWQVSPDKPLRATFYEIDGYEDFLWDKGKVEDLVPKRSYILRVSGDNIDREQNTEIYEGENYPSFPIVPLWGNPYHQSEIVGIQESIDCYDLIKSGFANTIDDASFIYWTIKNAGGMDDTDLAHFVERLRTVHAANVDDDQQAEAHNVEAPTAGREALLDRLEKDLYKDYMALDTTNIASGAVTATQIKAAYEPINSKANEFEPLVKDFIADILKVAQIDDVPTFSRSTIVNTQEEINTVLASAEYLPRDYVSQKIVTLLGDGDKADDILAQLGEEEGEAMIGGEDETVEAAPEEL